MALYEHIFLARQDITAQQMEELMNQYKGVIEANDAKVTKVEYWGVKSLAFRMNKNKKAHFALFNVDGSSKAIDEVERQMRLNEDVLRYMTIRVNELEEGPSVMMVRKDKDDRRLRGDESDDGETVVSNKENVA